MNEKQTETQPLSELQKARSLVDRVRLAQRQSNQTEQQRANELLVAAQKQLADVERRIHELDCTLSNMNASRQHLVSQVEQALVLLRHRQRALIAHDKHADSVRQELEQLRGTAQQL